MIPYRLSSAGNRSKPRLNSVAESVHPVKGVALHGTIFYPCPAASGPANASFSQSCSPEPQSDNLILEYPGFVSPSRKSELLLEQFQAILFA